MRTLLIGLLLVSIAQTASPQNGASTREAPSLTVIKKTWRKSRFRPGWDRSELPSAVPPPPSVGRSGQVDSERSGATPPPPPVVRRTLPPAMEGYTYEAKVKNTGAKPITAVGWDYVFTDPSNGKRTHHRFFERTKISPAKEKVFTRFTREPPTRTVSAAAADKQMAEEVVINYIEYRDGSKWQRQ